MEGLKQKIEGIVQKNLPNDKLYLVDIILPGGKNTKKILVLIDGDEGVNIDTYTKMSRALSAELDELDLLEQAYVLEVSSPGVEYPLQLKRQYHKNIGRSVKVVLKDEAILTGKLLAVSEESITIAEENPPKKGKKPGSVNKPPETGINEVNIPFSDIKKTNVLVSFT